MPVVSLPGQGGGFIGFIKRDLAGGAWTSSISRSFPLNQPYPALSHQGNGGGGGPPQLFSLLTFLP
jgi:hypothetical protein